MILAVAVRCRCSVFSSGSTSFFTIWTTRLSFIVVVNLISVVVILFTSISLLRKPIVLISLYWSLSLLERLSISDLLLKLSCYFLINELHKAFFIKSKVKPVWHIRWSLVLSILPRSALIRLLSLIVLWLRLIMLIVVERRVLLRILRWLTKLLKLIHALLVMRCITTSPKSILELVGRWLLTIKLLIRIDQPDRLCYHLILVLHNHWYICLFVSIRILSIL